MSIAAHPIYYSKFAPGPDSGTLQKALRIKDRPPFAFCLLCYAHPPFTLSLLHLLASVAFLFPSLLAFFAMSRKSDHGQTLLARVKAQGYLREAHRDQDEIRRCHTHIDQTKKDQDAALDRYLL